MLTWAHTRWQHVSAQPAPEADALELLERAEAGERFRCVEYSRLLTAALQAQCIPARMLNLRQAQHYAGFGGAHMVTEAWIDELGEWVMLDGQNGAFYQNEALPSEHAQPLGTLELLRRFAAGGQPPLLLRPDGTQVENTELWWTYWAVAAPQGSTATDSVVPYVDGQPVPQRLITKHKQALWPDLSGLNTSLTVVDGKLRANFRALHPYARSISVEGQAVNETGLVFPTKAGEYAWQVQAVGAYGPLGGKLLRFRVT